MRALSIAKFEECITNEDAALAKEGLIAVSDGAGGGGVFADKWSRYLVENLPNTPILDYQSFDKWIDSIWEPFYNDCEQKAKREGGMLLGKFYDEGSFSTLVAVWSTGQWISYGDSVAFCYNQQTGLLQHTFGKLSDFNNPPYLVNCKDPTKENGFKSGIFDIRQGDIVFAVSDALAHYILMMYEISNKEQYSNELNEAIYAHTKNSNFIKAAMDLPIVNFEKDVVLKLMRCNNRSNLKPHLQSLEKKGLLGHDDYSIAIM